MLRFDAVAHSPDTAFVLSHDWRILHVNDGYRSFAQENGGEDLLGRWPIGAHIEHVIPTDLRPFYRHAFEQVRATQQCWEHDYECSSPELYRRMHMVVYPVEPSAVLVVSSPIVVRQHTQEQVEPALYEQRGVLVACSHCRRFRSPSEPRSWHWVPTTFATHRETSATGCAPSASSTITQKHPA
jgi:hypothetical protein